MSKQLQMPALQITLDAYAAEQAKRAAQETVAAHADGEWKTVALDAVKQVAQRKREFTTDDVLAAMQDAPVWTHELRALGPVMTRAAAAGYIRATDRFVASASVSRHRAPKRVWSSQIYEPRGNP